jgi:hypothetical protein
MQEITVPLTNEEKTHYEFVKNSLEMQRDDVQQQVANLQIRLNDLHHSISTISKCLTPDTDAPSSRPPSPTRSYANISVRWAILDLLSDSQPRTTAEIAETLLAAGIRTRATNFANNVSAVLSTTMLKEPHTEVRQLTDGKWELTEKGKAAIDYIRSTPKFRGAMRSRAFAKW